MKLVVFGATGGTGKKIVARALADGHDGVAVARRPEAVTATGVTAVKGDVLDAASVGAAVAGADAVLSAIGPSNNKQPGTVISDGVTNMLAACATAGVRRFVFESGLMVGDGRGLSWFNRTALGLFRRFNGALAADKRIAEKSIRDSGLDWVIVRPVALDDSPPTDDYKTGVDIPLALSRKLSHADVADFMIKAVTDASVVRTIQDIGH